MNKTNYQKQTDKIISSLGNTVPRLLLHACCAPCSSYCLEYLAEHFEITVFYYNPNITEKDEYLKRVEEEKRLISLLDVKHKISFIEGNYEPEKFFDMTKGLEDAKEGGIRCFGCYRLRLEETAHLAKELDFDYFTTTLTISPLKNAAKLNEIAFELADKYGVKALPSDFKKKEGYKRSIELSAQYGLYRQNYCGCIYSKR